MKPIESVVKIRIFTALS